jgi:hypothetical protein
MRRRRSKLARERDRIAHAIGVIVLGATPCAAVSQACSSSSPEIGTLAIDGSADNQTPDAVADHTAAVDSDTSACGITATPFDAGRLFDAEGGGIDLSCTYDLPCGLPPTLVAVGCETFIGDPDGSPDAYVSVSCTIPEGQGCTDGSFTPGVGGALSMVCLDCFGGGRRPRGLRRPQVQAKNAVGEYFAKMAHEEHASIFAFTRMHEELVHFGAPRTLLAATRRAIRDEERHARIMSRLARDHGAVSTPSRIRKNGRRSLEAMAIENVSEGCINETFGAILLRWQALHTTDETLRATLCEIADDESRHAALSWALAGWIEKRLDFAANRRVLRARSRTLKKWIVNASKRSSEHEAMLGLPTSHERVELAARMAAAFGLS